jgi:CelD/BcsL family acetyltransferase involved in cellulose biosynthesis
VLGQVEITALRVNEMAIAFEIAVRRESYYGFFYIAYLPDYHKHGPGRQLMLHNIERAMSEDCTGSTSCRAATSTSRNSAPAASN